MKLQTISFYRENFVDKSFWKYENLNFENINLIVGQNSAGKSRIVRTIFALSELITYNKINTLANIKFHWNAKFLSSTDEIYHYEIIYQNNHVLLEKLTLNGEDFIIRNNRGSGKIKSSKLDDYLDFEVDLDVLILFNKKDKLHHPFIIELAHWAENLSYYNFGAPLGQNTNAVVTNKFMPKINQNTKKIKLDSVDKSFIKNDMHVVVKFHIGIDQIGDKFKNIILEDINSLGYNVTDIKLDNSPETASNAETSLMCLYVQENNLSYIPQVYISQGMFRALSIIIQITFNRYLAIPTSLIIDDIGEGLDFERSSKLIKLLIDRVNDNPDKQLFLTTNDKYVMNSVPLKYWNIVYSENSEIKCKNINNSKQIFEDFAFTGLNNFDFFTGKIFQKTSLIDHD
ncbi:MAG: AAA family ATPase [Sulfurimonas sp.]|nr:AAA family ATPase [Sulfurimonas sp.]